LLLLVAAPRLLFEELLLLTEGADEREELLEELTLEADFVFGAELRETAGADRLELLLFVLTADLLSLLFVEKVADFCGEVLAERFTVELRVALEGALRTDLASGLTEELLVLLL
jgi:hypothetical protein